MNEASKNRVILILAISALVFFIGTIDSCSNAFQQKTAMEKERALRFDLEEGMSKFQNQINKKNEELQAEKLAHSETKEALLKAQSTIEELQAEFQKAGK